MKIDELKKTLAKLEANLATASNKATALQTERRRIAFSAYSGGDGQARSILDELNTNSAIANLENENARAAIEECRRQLALAEAEWEADAPKRRATARQAREIVEEAETFGGVMAEGLDRLCESFAAFSACLEKLERFGYPVATSRLRYLAYTRAVQESSTSGRTGLRHCSSLSPP